ncbi:MAG TPA: glycosyltransferase family 2 protein [Verrucomicrobiae bacterium]|nr:glycosyltransferase family 2 protein [Verrucomicrobiae bacterium]
MQAACPVISVVTPSYNQGRFLPQTIESVLSQEGDFSIDFIVVDGGSTDDSVDVLRHYEGLLRQGDRQTKCRGISFRWTSESDSGQTDALMKGFRQSTGGILAWLNSDDTYLAGALQAASTHFAEHPDTGLLYGDSWYCDTDGNVIGRYRTADFDFERLAWFNFICQPSTFFRRDVFQRVGGLDESLHFAMDYDLWIRIGREFPCRYLPQFLSTYRLHEASKTVQDETLYRNCEEGLAVARKYYGWAPVTRVYNSCSFACRMRMPRVLVRSRLVLAAAAVLCTAVRSIRLNRGIRVRDLKLMNAANFRKLFRTRLEIMTGSDRGAPGCRHH